MEELLLGLDLPTEELNIVDNEDVDVAVASLECSGLIVANAVDEFIREFLGTDISNSCSAVQRPRVMTDCVKQVSLAETRTPVDEQRVVGGSGALGYSDGGGVCEAVT